MLKLSDLFEDGFAQIARYGAGEFAVSMRLQKAFAALRTTGDPGMADNARRYSARALELSVSRDMPPDDLRALKDMAARAAG